MPTSTDRDKVRLMIGDTVSGAYFLSDAEVNTFLDYRSTRSNGGTIFNHTAAAADAAGAIAAKFAREFDFAEDDQRFTRSQKHGQYLALERELRNRSGGYSVPITAGTASPT